MSAKFFDNFGIIEYNGQQVVNILARPKILEKVSINPYAFYDYEVKESDRPDQIARGYYKDPFFSWIVYLSNKIIDPYFGWYLPQQQLEKMIVARYGSYERANEKVLCYRVNWDEDPSVISVSNYNSLPDFSKKYWSPLFAANQTVAGYQRAEHPWMVETNYYHKITTSNNQLFSSGDLITLKLTGETHASGEVYVANSQHVIIKHVIGNPLKYVRYPVQTPVDFISGDTIAVSNGTLSINANVVINNQTSIVVETGNAHPTGVSTLSKNAVSTSTLDTTFTVSSVVNKTTNTSANIISSELVCSVIAPAEQSYWSPWTAYEAIDEDNASKRNIRLLGSGFAGQALADLKRIMK